MYVLDTEKMTELNNRNLDAGGIVLGAGDTYELPNNMGSITFDDLKRYIALDVNYDPGKMPIAIFSGLALLGLIISMFTPPPRLGEAPQRGRQA